MAVTQQTLSAMADIVSATASLTDRQARTLTRAYAQAWDAVERELAEAVADMLASAKDGTVTRAQVLKNTRLRRALRHLTDSLEELARDAGVTITKDLHEALRKAGRAQSRVTKTMLPAEAAVADWAMVNEKTIDAIVKRTTQRIESRLKRLPRQQAAVMKRELLRGVSVGSNPRETARRIMKNTQGRFEGGSARAVRIARTETLDAMRAGAAQVDKLNKDVLKGWRWSADLSPRTCQACIGMHGRTFDLDQPGPEGHPNCRCARVPVTKSWADLGFKDIKEPPDLFPSAEAWFKGLGQGEQKRLLGSNYDAWTAGRFPLSQWAARKENPDWRPSWMPASAK